MNEIIEHPYEERFLRTSQLIVPHETYQRDLLKKNAALIASGFDARLLNDPKVSLRDDKFYVFDGQTTIEALKMYTGSEDIAVRCRVFEGLTEEDEALLFAAQFGFSKPVKPGFYIRARIFGKDPEALAFQAAVESVGLELSYTQQSGEKRIACVGTAFSHFQSIGPDLFTEALSIIKEAWGGVAESLRSENLSALCLFVDRYRGEYNRSRLVKRLAMVGPMVIYQRGRLVGSALPGSTKFLAQVVKIYNGTSKKNALPIKY